jgi:hypothetical protein
VEPRAFAGYSLKTTNVVDAENTELMLLNLKGPVVGVDAGLILKWINKEQRVKFITRFMMFITGVYWRCLVRAALHLLICQRWNLFSKWGSISLVLWTLPRGVDTRVFCKGKVCRVFDSIAVVLVVALVSLGSTLFIEKM